MSIELVIFDCDGVLVDSEPIANRVFTQALRGLGFAWSYQEVCERLIGLSMTRCVELIEAEHGAAVPADFVTRLQEQTLQAFHTEQLQPVAGIPQLLQQLELPFCVASSGELLKMNTTLGITGLLPQFEGRMFSAAQVARGKPAPDLFLLAASASGVAPEQCVVIEDSVPGVLAAGAAGMPVLGYAARADGAALATAGALVFDTMESVPDLIASGMLR